MKKKYVPVQVVKYLTRSGNFAIDHYPNLLEEEARKRVKKKAREIVSVKQQQALMIHDNAGNICYFQKGSLSRIDLNVLYGRMHCFEAANIGILNDKEEPFVCYVSGSTTGKRGDVPLNADALVEVMELLESSMFKSFQKWVAELRTKIKEAV